MEAASWSRPSNVTRPPAMTPGGVGTRRKSESAVTDLPEPDSPTSPTRSPGASVRLTPPTAAKSRSPMRNSVRRSSTASSPSGGAPAGTRSRRTAVAAPGAARAPDFNRGSSTSRTPSPTRLMLMTSAKIIRPGITETCGAVNNSCRPSPSIEPRSACGGCAPRPRKDSPAVSRIIQPTVVDMVTTIVGSTFGSTSLNRIAGCEAPESRAASTNSRRDSPSVIPRMLRAKKGMLTTAMA